jgi:hypothetical protein
MRRLGSLTSILLFSLALAAPVAHAAKPHFITGTASVTDGDLRIAERIGVHGGLLVSFIEVGLGDNEVTTYLVTADASATYVCVNNGGNRPQAANKATVGGPVSVSATLTADQNGRVEGSLPVPPLGPGEFGCPKGQNMVLESVSYTNVLVTDTTHGASLSIPGTFSLTFPL